MKKLVLLILVVLFASFTYFGTNFAKMSKKIDGEVTVYSSSQTTLSGYASILNVEHYMTTGKVADIGKLVKNTDGVQGVSIKTRGSIENLNDYLKMYSANIVKAQNVDGVQIYYAYSPRLREKINVFGESVNIEIAFNNGMVTIGSPIIIGSY